MKLEEKIFYSYSETKYKVEKEQCTSYGKSKA